MKSRKTVLMNLFEGRNGDTNVEMDLWTQQGKESVGRVEKVGLTYTMCKIDSQRESSLGALR